MRSLCGWRLDVKSQTGQCKRILAVAAVIGAIFGGLACSEPEMRKQDLYRSSLPGPSDNVSSPPKPASYRDPDFTYRAAGSPIKIKPVSTQKQGLFDWLFAPKPSGSSPFAANGAKPPNQVTKPMPLPLPEKGMNVPR